MAIDPTKLNFISDKTYMKQYRSGVNTVNVSPYMGGAPQTATLDVHGLDYHPVYRVNILDEVADTFKSHGFHQGIPPNEVVIVRAYTTTTQLKVELVNNNLSSQDVDIYWRIYVDEQP